MCIRDRGRAARAKALKSALDVFVTPNDLPAKDGDLSNWLGKRAATARALGSLPFRTADEPLMVVRACARACALDGAALHESLRDASDVSARDAARCGAFSLLCRLKAHIKRRHRLGDARCAAYDGDCDKQLSAVRDDAPLICGPLFARSALAAVGTTRGGSVRSSLVVDLGRLLAEEQDDGDLDRPAKKPRGRPPKAKVEPKAEPKEEDAPKKPRGRPPKVPKKESEKPKPAKKSVDPKYKTPKGQATKPSTAGSETSPPKSKPTGGMLNKKVMATWDSDIAYPARVVGVTWSDSLDLLTHVDLKFDDGAFWNKAPVTTIKGLA